MVMTRHHHLHEQGHGLAVTTLIAKPSRLRLQASPISLPSDFLVLVMFSSSMLAMQQSLSISPARSQPVTIREQYILTYSDTNLSVTHIKGEITGDYSV